MTQVVIHPRVTVGSQLRVWAGVFDPPPTGALTLQWSLDGQIGQPTTLTELRPAGDDRASRVRTGVFEFDGVAPNSRHRVELGKSIAAQRICS